MESCLVCKGIDRVELQNSKHLDGPLVRFIFRSDLKRTRPHQSDRKPIRCDSLPDDAGSSIHGTPQPTSSDDDERAKRRPADYRRIVDDASA